jgi:hypothetical protein
MKKQILDRYTLTRDNEFIIDIAAGKVEDLFNDFDKYAPYRKKELDQDLVNYIIDSVREIGKEDFVIQFRFTSNVDERLESRVRESVRNYFLYLKDLKLRVLSGMTRTSLILFSIGVLILFLSVWINQKAAGFDTVFTHVFAEGLTVAAWVSLWNALATFLINWAPHHRQIKRFERISRAPMYFHSEAQERQ